MTREPSQFLEIYLQPGEFYFGDQETRIRTLLGSCVAITMWHPARKIGGMCHYMLPTRAKTDVNAPDGRYADEAIELFLDEISAAGTRPCEYKVKLFGGGDQFPGAERCVAETVPHRNLKAGRALVAQHGFRVSGEDLGGAVYRNLIFDIWNGNVWVQRNEAPAHAIKTRRREKLKVESDAGPFRYANAHELAG